MPSQSTHLYSWRNKFAEIYESIIGSYGKSPRKHGGNEPKASGGNSSLSIRMNQGKLVVDYRNLHYVELNYFIIDLEVLFSLKPFILQDTAQFDIIEPNYSNKWELDLTGSVREFDLNKKVGARCCMIEAKNSDCQLRESVINFICALKSLLYEEIGNIDVYIGGNPKMFVYGVYIKVFAQMKNGTEEFYKDGYTDISGRFDYASISVDKLKHVKRFAILVSHPIHGSKILECKPPLNE
mgnify:FL=1